jgi:hypothetical protein
LEDKILKLRNILLVIVLLLVSLTLAAFAPNPQTTPPIQAVDLSALIPILIGAIGVPLVNMLKDLFKFTDSRYNLWLTFGASLILSVIAMYLTGLILPMSNPADLQKFLTTVFTTATLIYQSFPGQKEPTPTPNPEAGKNQPTPEGASPAEQAQR